MKKSLKWKSKVNNLNSELCMASEIQTKFQDEACFSSNTHTLAKMCFSPRPYISHPCKGVRSCHQHFFDMISFESLCFSMVTSGEQTGITSVYIERTVQRPVGRNKHNIMKSLYYRDRETEARNTFRNEA